MSAASATAGLKLWEAVQQWAHLSCGTSAQWPQQEHDSMRCYHVMAVARCPLYAIRARLHGMFTKELNCCRLKPLSFGSQPPLQQAICRVDLCSGQGRNLWPRSGTVHDAILRCDLRNRCKRAACRQT